MASPNRKEWTAGGREAHSMRGLRGTSVISAFHRHWPGHGMSQLHAAVAPSVECWPAAAAAYVDGPGALGHVQASRSAQECRAWMQKWEEGARTPLLSTPFVVRQRPQESIAPRWAGQISGGRLRQVGTGHEMFAGWS